MICSGKKVPQSLEITEGMPSVGSLFSNSFFAIVRASSLQQGNASYPKNVKTIRRTYWSSIIGVGWIKFSCSYSNYPEGILWKQSQVFKDYGPDKSDIAGRLLLQYYKKSPHHCLLIIWVILNALLWLKECKTQKYGVCQGAWKNKTGVWFPSSPISLTSSNYLPTLISLIQEQIVVILEGHQDFKTPVTRSHVLQSRNGVSPHAL